MNLTDGSALGTSRVSLRHAGERWQDAVATRQAAVGCGAAFGSHAPASLAREPWPESRHLSRSTAGESRLA
jgi:hypothetical protein